MVKRIEEPSFNAPIPGMSLTSEVGGRPWEQPPQLSTVEEAAEHYSEKMQNPEFTTKLVDVLEDQIPVTVISNSIMLAGVMDGLHSIDVGVLVTPIIMENIMMVGDAVGVDYVTGLDDDEDIAPTKEDYFRVMERDGGVIEMEDDTEDEEEMPQPKGGLMARPVRSE